MMKKSRVNKLLMEDTSTVFDFFDKVKPSRKTEKAAAIQAAAYGHMKILKYLVEERKIPEVVKVSCVLNTAGYDQLDCLKYLIEEARAPLDTGDTSLTLVTSSEPSA